LPRGSVRLYLAPRHGEGEEQMTVIDPEYQRHRRTWIGFTRFIKISLAVVILILIGMAIFLL
jgi:hypothetical protein